ncbi:hypothetical protein ACGFZR_15095 [Streptomyces sp. NPDC048241]|uniref:hypothetical protein n=1 Tax=Streptomyces sp. NPDC048241 TaxID=3365521 RepID=UPI0037176290
MPDDCIHEVSLCPSCDGLVAVRLDRVEGIQSLDFGDGREHTDVRVYFGPAPEPCPHTT